MERNQVWRLGLFGHLPHPGETSSPEERIELGDHLATIAVTPSHGSESEGNCEDESERHEKPFSPCEALERVKLITVWEVVLERTAVMAASKRRSDSSSSGSPENPRKGKEPKMRANRGHD